MYADLRSVGIFNLLSSRFECMCMQFPNIIRLRAHICTHTYTFTITLSFAIGTQYILWTIWTSAHLRKYNKNLVYSRSKMNRCANLCMVLPRYVQTIGLFICMIFDVCSYCTAAVWVFGHSSVWSKHMDFVYFKGNSVVRLVI